MGPSITVRVGSGPSAREFSVHKDLITHYSPFFKAALSDSRWKEGMSNMIDLPEDEPQLFKFYLCWLYGTWPFEYITTCIKFDRKTLECAEFIQLADAYVFGNKILDFDFCDMVLDSLCAHAHHAHATDLVPTGSFFEIWKVSKKHSAPRKLLLDAYVYSGSKEWFGASDSDEFDQEAWRCIAEVLIADREDDTELGADEEPRKSDDTCRYHLHINETGACYKKTREWGSLKKALG